jgi:MinD-like ATPase involved in chromosome partitioning or flagellar assembly
MSLTHSLQGSAETAEHVLQLLSTNYPDLAPTMSESPRLRTAVEGVARSTQLSGSEIFDALTARELATAQRPIGVLISRCTELVESPSTPVSPIKPQRVSSLSELSTIMQSDPSASKPARFNGENTIVSTQIISTPDESNQHSSPPVEPPHETRAPQEVEPTNETIEKERSMFVPPLAKAPPRPIPGRGYQRMVFRATAGGLNLGQGRREREQLGLFDRITTPVTGSSNIVVLGLKGGVGRTTVSLALGHTFAAFRNDRVIAIDASADPGTLGQRVVHKGAASVRDLVARRSLITAYSDVRQLAVQQSTGLEILNSGITPFGSPAISVEDYESAINCLSAYFNLIITDTGSAATLRSLPTVLHPADQLVFVTAPMVDAGWSTALLLDWLDDNGFASLVERATIVVNHLQNRVDVKSTDFDRYFQSRCAHLVHIPWDETLVGGGVVSIDHLDRDTRHAYRVLAATIAEDFHVDQPQVA